MLRYAITDRLYARADAERWLRGGMDFVQVRDKSLPAGALVTLTREVVAALEGKTKVLVNGRADVALAAGAAGVHLTAQIGELLPDQIRTVFAAAGSTEPVISVSCHTLAEVSAAKGAGVDLILFGPVFEKRVEGEVVLAGVGLEALRAACTAAETTPVLALGGVTLENSRSCMHAGASGVAGIRLFA